MNLFTRSRYWFKYMSGMATLMGDVDSTGNLTITTVRGRDRLQVVVAASDVSKLAEWILEAYPNTGRKNNVIHLVPAALPIPETEGSPEGSTPGA